VALALTPPVAVLTTPGAAPADAAAASASAPAVRLRSTGGGVAEADLALAARLVRPAGVGGTGRRTATLGTSGFSMVGVTWTGARAPGRVAVRWPDAAGHWGRWRTLPEQTDLPDGAEKARRHGTQPVWTGRRRALQVAVMGHRPAGLRLALMDTGPTQATTAAAPTAARALGSGTATATAVAVRRPTSAPRPALLTRHSWGADPAWRNGSPRYVKRIKQVHLHHTATANDYAAGDVPGILRGIYRYHTHSLGWFDIGYNFLVDRFGRTWVGRSGGAAQAVRGAHTLGFNHESVGIALLGSFGKQRPTKRAMDAVVRLAAWKLDQYGGRPRRKVTVRSEGSDRFRAGTRVTLPVIDGHRDTNETSCPGQRLYDLLPRLRDRVGRRVNHYNP
jgi:uncharacterized protein with LGFP repeats